MVFALAHHQPVIAGTEGGIHLAGHVRCDEESGSALSVVDGGLSSGRIRGGVGESEFELH